MSCLLGGLYTLLPDVDQDPVVFELPLSARESLLALVMGAPFMTCDMRATHSDRLVATDASDSHGGVCRTAIPVRIHQHLWRMREQKRSYTWL